MNQKKNYLTTPKESGFTLVEVIVAVVILSFAIFATLRVITASLNSITRQGQRVKALHLAQAHLAKVAMLVRVTSSSNGLMARRYLPLRAGLMIQLIEKS